MTIIVGFEGMSKIRGVAWDTITSKSLSQR